MAPQLGFRQRKLVGAAATRQALFRSSKACHGRPSVLFTASHGMVWPSGDPHQLRGAGRAALPGLSRVRLRAAVAFRRRRRRARHCARAWARRVPFRVLRRRHAARRPVCLRPRQDVPVIAPEPFVAALPRRLLAHPNGGALACIAHVERAWGSSITGVASSPQIRAFQRALATLLVGKPAGLAVQEFNDLSATLSEILARLLGEVARKQAVDDVRARVDVDASNDAGGFVLIGDPAVRLRVNDLL